MATGVSIGAVVAAVAVQLLVPGGWGAWAWLPLVSGLLVGLPHGAVDHLVPARRLGWSPARTAGFTLGYAVLAAVALLAFRAAPGPSLAVFVAVSVWHFGTGETAFADERAGRQPATRWAPALVVGALVLLVPLARGHRQTSDVVAAVAPGWDGDLAGVATPLLVAVLGLVLALGTVLARHGCRLEVSELAALSALAVLTPPLVAFGVYFGWWHAVRHLSRLVSADPATAADLATGHPGAPLRRLALWATVPTLTVLGVLAALWTAVDGTTAFLALVLPVLAALTVPHVLVVSWMDRTADRAASLPAPPAG